MPGVLVDSSSHPPFPFESFLDPYSELSVSPTASVFQAPRLLPRSKLGLSPISAAESPPLSEASFREAMASPRDVLSALQRFLPSNREEEGVGGGGGGGGGGAMDAYTCDEFRMYEFKVRRCMRGRSHDWTECPFAHPGEKARRRDPRRFHYSGAACPDFRKGSCKKGDTCEFAHGVFECWLHPARYRTQPCKDGRGCRRRVCFFAHSVQQLRILPSPSDSLPSPSEHFSSPKSLLDPLDDFSPSSSTSRYLLQKLIDHSFALSSSCSSSSPTSTLLCPHSPPFSSPPSSPPLSPDAASAALFRSRTFSSSPQSPLSVPAHRRHLSRLQTLPAISIPPSSIEAVEDGGLFSMSPVGGPVIRGGSEELAVMLEAMTLRRSEGRFEDRWGGMERVESGSALRANFYGKIGKENGVGVGVGDADVTPDLQWVTNLVDY